MNALATAALAALVVGGSALALMAGSSSDPRIASTSFAEVCASDGKPGSAYSRAHRVIPRKPVHGAQIDHRLPLCLGGADNDANVWVQPIEEALRKDELERATCIAVCRDRTMSLADGQAIFLGDWRKHLR